MTIHYNVVRALDVPAACFNPPPKVDSSFMVLERLETPYVDGGRRGCHLRRLVRSAFAMRRKTLLNNLISGFALNREQAASYLEAVGLPYRQEPKS